MQPSNGSLHGTDTSSRTADTPDVRLILQPAKHVSVYSCIHADQVMREDVLTWSGGKKVPIKDSFHVLKTTYEAPRCASTELSFPCSRTSYVHICWMTEQTDDSAKKLSVFHFAQRTQHLISAWTFFPPPPLPHCYGVLFLDWLMRLWCHVLYLHIIGHIANGKSLENRCKNDRNVSLFVFTSGGVWIFSLICVWTSQQPFTGNWNFLQSWMEAVLRCDWVENATRAWHEWG